MAHSSDGVRLHLVDPMLPNADVLQQEWSDKLRGNARKSPIDLVRLLRDALDTRAQVLRSAEWIDNNYCPRGSTGPFALRHWLNRSRQTARRAWSDLDALVGSTARLYMHGFVDMLLALDDPPPFDEQLFLRALAPDPGLGLHADSHRQLIAVAKRLLTSVERSLVSAKEDIRQGPVRTVLNDCRHSDDFTSVTWFGRSLHPFSSKQAQIVEVLWRAYESGNAIIREAYIAEQLQHDGETLNDEETTVRGFSLQQTMRIQSRRRNGRRRNDPHPAMGYMIHKAGKGLWTLAAPQRNEAAST